MDGNTTLRTALLIVDGDELDRSKLMAVMTDAGFAVQGAASGREALQIMDKEFCPLVLTDRDLPGMNGLALCSRLRQRFPGGGLYIMLHSARAELRSADAQADARIDDFICKGAAPAQVVEHVQVGRRLVALETLLSQWSRRSLSRLQ